MAALHHVALHFRAKFHGNLAVKIIRELAPDMFAIELQGVTPLHGHDLPLRFVRSTNKSRNSRRARNSRTFVFPMEIPSASDACAMVKPFTSRSVIISRWRSGSAAIDS